VPNPATAQMIMWLIFGGFCIFALIWMRRQMKHSGTARKQTPLDIARERLARGEISEEEFERIKRQL